ncbi:hypothetical protein HNQ41_000497 [Texcoconibacillus texcoconensis]|uniref:Uncharacterized protein n=1 Tax=Texcoconibacillus texcoconensis TaxID=1095777 RepID=A0A840QLX1_9BACI|nr:hypothetical protein [Texcoconibacillus texcoconensis]
MLASLLAFILISAELQVQFSVLCEMDLCLRKIKSLRREAKLIAPLRVYQKTTNVTKTAY